MTSVVDLYSPAPQLVVAIAGADDARAHFAAEYGAARTGSGADPDVRADVAFAWTLPPGAPRDGHKTVRWSVEVDPPDTHPLRVRITVAGRPRRFALSMVQGFVVEPLVSIAAARKGLVLLPAAGLIEGEGACVVLGRSRSGKSSVVARAVAEGGSALGDDQVLVGSDGQVWSWPRRLRVYSDLRLTAPSAVAALPDRQRRALDLMRWVKTGTRGRVAPSLPLRWTDVGASAASGPVRIARVVVVERRGEDDAIAVRSLASPAVTALAHTILREQRSRFAAVAGPEWVQAVDDVSADEEQTLEAALAGVRAEHWTVPATWDAARAVSALTSRLSRG